METPSTIPTATLAEWVLDAGRRTLDLVADLTDEQLLGPRLPTINPPLWEIGHLAWFMEKWVLRDGGKCPSLRADADGLYDSAAIPHAVRWDLPLPFRAATLDYIRQVCEAVLAVLARGPSDWERYFIALSVFHEDMHGEAFLYTRQLLAYSRPQSGPLAPRAGPAGPLPGDVTVPGGTFLLGATPDEPFVFDNEKWAHRVELRPFAIARAPVTQAEFAAFVDAGGYTRRDLWTDAGWSWRESAQAEHSVYWRRDGTGWLRRDFDEWVPLEPHRPVIHVNWYEADAYCRWAGRRLPTEAEWEAAAAGVTRKRRFPWGDDPPDATRANLDGTAFCCVDVAACPAGDSAVGCRQMIGNVWEWTATHLGPYAGFVPDPYKEYSQPWFGTHKVLRGGAWPTRARLLRTTWRNFYTPDRRDVWAGFRTCAVE
jgi:iron(II)-dependent oxidoreductase